MATMSHGSYDEDHNRVKFSKMTGLRTRACHYMVGHPRWPYLATTLDGMIHRPTRDLVQELDYTTQPALIEELVALLTFAPTPVGLLEMKQTNMFGARTWLGLLKSGAPAGVPFYYHGQVQSQMHFTGIPWAVGAGQCGVGDMTGHYLAVDPNVADILDRLNEEVAEPLEEVRRKNGFN